MSGTRILIAMVAFAIVNLPLEGNAQDASKEKSETQRRLVRDAVRAVKSKEFETAARRYEEAYELSPNPMLLYNAAYAYGRAGRLKLALDASRRVEETGLEEPNYATRNASRFQGWSVALRARRRAAAIDENPHGSAAGRPGSGGTFAGDNEPAFDWIGGGAGAAGAGLLIGALIVDRQIAEEKNRLDEAIEQRDRSAYDESLETIKSHQKRGQILFVAGAALVAGGATLLAYDLTRNSPGEGSVAVGAGPDGMGVTFEIDF